MLTPYLITHLGSENYGLWILVLSSIGWFNFIDLGFSYAVQRNIVLALEHKDNARINVVFSVAVVLFSVLGFIAAGCVLFLAAYPEILGIDEQKQVTATTVIALLSLKVLFDFMMNSFHGFFTAYIRMDIDANLSTLNTIIKSILVVFLILDLNILGAVIATLIADVITQILKIYFAKRLHPEFKFSWKFVSALEVKSLFAYSKHLVLLGIAKSINTKVDPVIISHILGLKYVAIFNVINTLTNQVEKLVVAIVGIFQPVLTKLVARKANIDSTLTLILSLNFFVVVLFYAPLAILAEDFILLWVGSEFQEAAYIAPILGIAFLCKTVSRPISSLLLASAQHKLLSVVNIAGAVVNISLSITLASMWGLKGIAIATAVGFLLSDVILHLYLLKRYTDYPIIRPIIEFIKLLVIYCSVVYLGLFILSDISPMSWLELIISSATVFLCVLVLSWFVLLISDGKEKLVSIVVKKRSV